jgi:hypothetical protein
MRRFAWALLLLSGCPIGDLTSENDAATQPDVTSDAAPPNDGSAQDVQDGAAIDAPKDSPSDAPVDVTPKNIAFVQAGSVFFGTTGDITLNLVKSGDAIIVCVISSFATGVTDDANNNYGSPIYGPYNAGTNGVVRIFVSYNSKSAQKIHVTTSGVPDGSPFGYAIYAAEYTGITGNDQGTHGTSMSNATDGLATPGLVVSNVPSLLFGFALMNQNGKAPGTNFTAENTDDGNLVEDRLVTTAATYAATATQNDDGGGQGDIFLVPFH